MSTFLFHCPQKMERIASASLSGREHKYNPIFSLKDQGYFLPFSPMSCRAVCTIHSDPRTRACFPFYLGRILQCQARAWKVLKRDPCSRSVEKAQETALVWWDTNLAAARASPILQKPLEVTSCPSLPISTCFLIEKKNLIVFELFIYIKIWNLEAHQPLKILPCRNPPAFPWPELLLPARQSWKVSPWAPSSELKPWMLPGHKLRAWMHSYWIFILSILWKNSYNLRHKNSSIHEPPCEQSLCHRS